MRSNPTSTTDRVCRPCTQGVTYQSANSHTFGSCKRVRNCPSGHYVVSDPTLSSDRVCAKCASGKYSTSVNAKTCTPIGTCDAGEYAYFASANAGVDCRSCTLNVNYMDETDHSNEECKPVSGDCRPGEFEAVSPTRSSDRVCNNCHSGTFSTAIGAKVCKPHRTCSAGYAQSVAPTRSSDRQCRRCNGETEYQNNGGATSCKPVTTCTSTQYEETAPSPTNDRVCKTCRTSCSSGFVLVGTCGGTSNPTCQACHSSCSTCNGPTETDCTACADPLHQLTNGRCDTLKCTGNQFLDGDKCVTTCPSGTYKHADASEGNVCRACSSCGSGKWASGPCDGTTTRDTVCSAWSTCDIGEEELVTPTSERDRKCTPCNGDTEYQDQPGQLFCKTVTTCEHGEYVSANPTASTDRQCSTCGTGRYSASENAAQCVKCPPGTYQDEAGSPACNECGIGNYEEKQGQTQCSGIPEGYYGTGGTISTRTGISKCPAGFYCLGGSHDKRPCPPDQFQPLEGQHVCHDVTVCGDGEFVSVEPSSVRDRECSDCPTGTYQDDDDHDNKECIPWSTCPAGTHILQEGNRRRDRTCESCDPPHTYQDKANQATCKAVKDCPVGTEEAVSPTPSTDRVCKQCKVGVNFADDSGLQTCKPVTVCLPGEREVTAPTASSDRVCESCPPNTFTEGENEKTCVEHKTCGPGEKEIEEPSDGSQRECVPCEEGTYQSAKSHTSDSCIAVTDCEPGEYLVAAATRTSDAVCKSCKVGQTYSTTTNAKSCIPVDTCGVGEREKIAPTASSNRTCEPCDDGFFQDSPLHSFGTCKEWTDCSPGQYIAEPGSAESDRLCDDCSGVVTYQPKANQMECLNVTRCEADEYELTPPAANRDRVCAPCTAASSCNGNEYLAGTCGGNDGVENTRCAACHPTCNGCTGPDATDCIDCAAHLYEKNGICVDDCGDGHFYDGQTCEKCDGSCFNCDGPDAKDCTECDSNKVIFQDTDGNFCLDQCPDGFFSDSNKRCVRCTSCDAGTWASDECTPEKDTVCTPWSECNPGQKESISGTSERDRVCVNCNMGTEYQPLPDRSSCFPTSVCEEPYIETVAPTLTTDRLCSCDTLTCNKLINGLFEEEACAEPNDEELNALLDVCCSGQGEDGIRNAIQELDRYEQRHSCPGCQRGTCECTAGFVLVFDADSSDCRPCNGVDEFAPQAGMATCEAVTECERGQEEVSAPTRSSDRICRECPAGTIDDDTEATSSCKTCPQGHFSPEGSHGTCQVFKCRAGTSDSDQDPSTPCTSCTLGETYQDEEGQTSCKPVTECAPGFEEVQPMTLISDRVCDECPEGTFKPVEGQDIACQPVTTCATGFEETKKPTSTSDRECTECEEGVTFKELPGQAQKCVPVTECGPGEEEILAPTSDTDRVCRPCVLGLSFSAQDGEPCQPVTRCSASQYISTPATLTSDLECSDVSVCQFGFFESEAPTLYEDRECSECTPCPAGRYETRACSAAENTQCEGCNACPSGKYTVTECNEENDNACADCATCGDEQYRSAPCTLTSNTVCTNIDVCDPDQFELHPASPTTDRICRDLTQCDPDTEYVRVGHTATTDRQCHLITKCDPGEEELIPASASSDAKCIPCPRGSTDEDRKPKTRCQPCPYGHFVPEGSIGPCTQFACPAGTADMDRNASTPCTPCENGVSFSALPGQVDCTPVTECGLGYEEVVTPTIFTDRQCRRCIEGLFFRSESEEFCTRVSPCEPETFEIGAPTISTDRMCTDATQCEDGEFISRPLSPRQDRRCTPWSTCLSNEYELVAPTLLHDRECTPIRSCTSSEYEVSAPSATTDRLCATITTCPSEQFEVAEPTATTDRVCALAFSTNIVFDAKFNTLVGTSSRLEAFDRELREDINRTLDASLILRTEYTEGSIIVTVASLSDEFTAALFNLSVAGGISVQGYSSSPCEPDEFLDDPDPSPFGALPCSPTTECRSNQFQVSEPTTTTDRQCQIARICRLDEYVVSEFTATTDRVCGTTTTTTTTTTTSTTTTGNFSTTPLPSSSSSSAALSPGILAVIGVIGLLVLVVAIVFVVWRSRKAEKDRRQNEAIQQWAQMNKASDEISQANTLLRQLSLRDQSVLLFDNPTFAQPGGNSRPDWYVGQMTRAEAEQHVQQNSGNPGDFVVRESAANGNFVLTLLIENGQFEHHKLYKDAQGRFLVNGNRPQVDCMTLDTLVDHLSRYADGISVKLNVQQSYGQVQHQATIAEEDDEQSTYGALSKQTRDLYGSVMKKKDKAPYMYGPMARGEAEAILAQDRTKGNFLVRESKARPGTYAVSLVIDDGRVEHHTLRHNGSEFVLNDLPLSRRCDTMSDVINHLGTNEESMSCPLRLQRDEAPPAEIPGMEGFSNPNYTQQGAADGGYDPITAPRGVVANPGYQDLPPKPTHLLGDSAPTTGEQSSTDMDADAPPVNVRTLPKPFHLLAENPDDMNA